MVLTSNLKLKINHHARSLRSLENAGSAEVANETGLSPEGRFFPN
jgi:hypothetical protein